MTCSAHRPLRPRLVMVTGCYYRSFLTHSAMPTALDNRGSLLPWLARPTYCYGQTVMPTDRFAHRPPCPQTTMPTDHHAHRPPCPQTTMPTDRYAHRPLCPHTTMPTGHHAHRPPCPQATMPTGHHAHASRWSWLAILACRLAHDSKSVTCAHRSCSWLGRSNGGCVHGLVGPMVGVVMAW